jgi:subtilisin family serine protease
MKKMCLIFLAAAAASIYLLPAHTAARSDKFKRSSRPVAGSYIVVLNEDSPELKSDVPSAVGQLNREFPGNVRHTYDAALRGYSVEMTEQQAIALSDDRRVKYVEEDGAVDVQSTQSNATWGISRIDQRTRSAPQDTNYNYNTTGAGVSVYVIDTGVLISHPDFGGRAVDAFDVYRDGGDMTRCNGHGTHVAGTIGSNTYGVAKSVMIYSVKVYPCDTSRTGSMSDILSGIDWVTRNAAHPAVANMSMAGAVSQTLDDAVRSSSATGITYVVSAGNYNDDACRYSPARTPEAITVASTDERDYRSSISNYGACVDIFAPGEFITSLSNHLDSPTFIMSGTSTSSPHIAGVAALFLESNPAATPQQVSDAIVSNGSHDSIVDVGNRSPTLFVYSLFMSGGETPPCAGTSYSGVLSTPGSMSYQSSSAGFDGNNGRYTAIVSAPLGAVFSLALQKKSKRSWTTVTTSDTGQPINYQGRKGVYRWRIADVAGSGSYSLCAITP